MHVLVVVKKLGILLVWMAAGALLGAADFQAGLQAYQHGDFAAALREWKPLAEQGDAHAQYNLGLLYARGQGAPQDYAQAIQWYRKAAEQGVPAAQYNLGVMYANGQGVGTNPEEAKSWFLKAAGQGVTAAAGGLGRIYSEANGFHNPAEAEKWYRQAAGQGVASAAFQLGVMYDVGQGVTQSYTEALKWYRQAADAGYPAAMANLGILYYNGQGVKRDLVQAYAWLARAKEHGDPRAPELVPAAENKLSKSMLKKAQAEVGQWQPSQAAPGPPTNLFKPPPAATGGATTPGVSTTPATAPPARREVPAPGAAAVWTGIGRVIAIGDVHGDFEQFVNVLRSAALVDEYGNWVGGKTHMVQTGDVVDRGPDSRAVMDLLMKLEKQAAAAGGAVQCLIGNHEAMDIYGDLRFVSPGEYAAFADNGAEPESGHPPGFAEHRAAFAPDGVYGKWIRSHDAVIKIDRTLFLHAGLGAKYADWTVERINGEVRRELNDLNAMHGGIVTDAEGPLWFDGLAKGDEAQNQPLVDRLLHHFDVDRIVVGHTYADAAITPRFAGRVLMIDIGIPRSYDNIGKVGCLEIDNGKPYALHRGLRLDLPSDENGPDMLRYLRQAAALDPKPSPLAARIEKLQKQE